MLTLATPQGTALEALATWSFLARTSSPPPTATANIYIGNGVLGDPANERSTSTQWHEVLGLLDTVAYATQRPELTDPRAQG